MHANPSVKSTLFIYNAHTSKTPGAFIAAPPSHL